MATDPGNLNFAEIRDRTRRGVLQVAARSVAVRGIGLVGVLILATQLEPRDFGLVAFGLTFQVIGRYLSDAGIAVSLLRDSTPPEPLRLSHFLGFQLLAATVITAIVAVLSIPLGQAGEIAAIMASALLFECYVTPGSIASQHRLDFAPGVLSELATSLAFWTTAIVGVVAGGGVWAVAFAAPAASAVGAMVMIWRSGVGLMLPRFSFAEVRGLLRFGAEVQAAQVFQLMREQGVNIVIISVSGPTVLGFWNLAFRLLQTVWLIFQSIQRVAFPALARLIETGESPGPVVNRMLGLSTLASTLVLAGLVGCAPAAIPAALGPEWQPAVDVFAPAALAACVFGPITASAVGLLYAKGDAFVVARAIGLNAVVWGLIMAATLEAVGPVMIGVGMLIGAVAESTLIIRATRRHIDLPVVGMYVRPLLLVTLTAGPTYLLTRGLDENLGTAALAFVAATGAYLLALALIARPLLRDATSTALPVARSFQAAYGRTRAGRWFGPASRLAGVILAAAAVAIFAGYRPSFSPVGLDRRGTAFGAGNASLTVDGAVSPAIDAAYDTALLADRAGDIAQTLDTDDIHRAVARSVGIRDAQLSIESLTLPQFEDVNTAALGAQRSLEIAERRKRYRVVLRRDFGSTEIGIISVAPTEREAENLAAAMQTAAPRHIVAIQNREGIKPRRRIVLFPNDIVAAQTIRAHSDEFASILSGLAALIIGCVFLRRIRPERTPDRDGGHSMLVGEH